MFSEKLIQLAKLRDFESSVSEPTHKIEKSNPLCGDIVCLNLEIENNKLIKANSNYESCALVHASLNYLLKYSINKDLESIKKIIDEFEAYFINDKQSDFIVNETDLNMFDEIKESYPSRKNCVMLPFRALKQIF